MPYRAVIDSKAAIDDLVAGKVPESQTLEYKEALPGKSDKDSKEFLADVSSFANAIGGNLIYGITEERDEDNQPTGVPAEASGLGSINLDAERTALEQRIRSGISPPLPGVRVISPSQNPADSPLLVVHIPRSWQSPHRVTYQHGCRFWSRAGSAKYELEVHQLRHAFLMSHGIAERVRGFRDERLARIVANDTPVPLEDGPRLVLHLAPLWLNDEPNEIDLTPLQLNYLQFLPLNQSGAMDGRFNFDGFVTTSGKDIIRSYLQIFRSGAMEAVDVDCLKYSGTQNLISGGVCVFLRHQIRRLLDSQKSLGVNSPVNLSLSLLGVKGKSIVFGVRPFPEQGRPIDRDDLFLPDVLIEDPAAFTPELLKPAFDALAQSGGHARCPMYDEAGKWKNPNA